VFLRAYQHFDEIRHSPTAGGWLKTVATNLCLNHLSRYRARWRFFSEMRREDDADDAPEVEFAAPDTLEQGLDSADQRRVLEEALHKLPPAQRVPLVLFHFENKSYEEIAAQLKVTLAKVKTDIHRGREALKRKLRVALSGDKAAQAAMMGKEA
jgi:RNA polymerase sigma-70 factor (ECF subfamily)